MTPSISLIVDRIYKSLLYSPASPDRQNGETRRTKHHHLLDSDEPFEMALPVRHFRVH